MPGLGVESLGAALEAHGYTRQVTAAQRRRSAFLRRCARALKHARKQRARVSSARALTSQPAARAPPPCPPARARVQDWYTFPRKHLLAAWYAPPRELYEALPRVFVSQLQVGKHRAFFRLLASMLPCPSWPCHCHCARAQVEKLSPAAQAIIASYTDSLPASPLSAMLGAWGSALTGALPWRQPSRADYQALLGESEYGAW